MSSSSSSATRSGFTRDGLAFLAASALVLTGISATGSLASNAALGQSSCRPAGHGHGHANGRCTDSSATSGSTSTSPSGSTSPTKAPSGGAASASAAASRSQSAPAGTVGAPGPAIAAVHADASTVAAGHIAPGTVRPLVAAGTGNAQSEPVQAAGGVLGASTGSVFDIGQAAALNGPAAGATSQVLPSLGHQLDASKSILILLWLALNAGFVIIRKRRARKRKGDFRPISLGGWTYTSSTGLGA
jgi:hypothetical protein